MRRQEGPGSRRGGHFLGGMHGYVMLVAGAHSALHRIVLIDGVCVCVFLCVCGGGGGEGGHASLEDCLAMVSPRPMSQQHQQHGLDLQRSQC